LTHRMDFNQTLHKHFM